MAEWIYPKCVQIENQGVGRTSKIPKTFYLIKNLRTVEDPLEIWPRQVVITYSKQNLSKV